MEGALGYIISYVAFVSILIIITANYPIELISGITKDQIDTLNSQYNLPSEPTIVDYFIFPFGFTWDFLSKMWFLLNISSQHQALAFVLTPLTFGLIFVIVGLIRGW